MSLRPSQAEETSAMLQQAALQGVVVMIPGALEMRARHPADQAVDARAAVVIPYASGAGTDRQQLEYAREGGGSPKERTGKRTKTIFARVWRYIMRPTEAPVVRQPPLPEQR